VSISYVLRRVAFFVAVIWLTATAIFFLIHLAPGDPISYQVGRMQATGQALPAGPELIAEYKQQFGLDRSLGAQYWSYLNQLAHFNLGYSVVSFPTSVSELIGDALPWTIGLLVVATVISWVLRSLLGGIMSWRASPRLARSLLPLLMIFAAVPYYLLALFLLYVFAYKTQWLPTGGAKDVLRADATGFSEIRDIAEHALLPGLSIVLAFVGFWMLSMRATMVSVLGSDYLLLAEAKGLPERRIFLRYGLRTAILPQVTGLAIFLGYVVSGAVIVETLFAYPGLGQLLVTAINGRDYPMIEGIALMMVVTVAATMLLLDLLLPLLDPRIRYERR
jgi:peptide/nickel transport system permease protein